MANDSEDTDKNLQNLGGRPRKDFNPKDFESLCALQCTKTEIASFFSCSEETIDRRIKEYYGETYKEVYKRFREFGNISLRRMQWTQAKRSTSMLIFLGKQYLNQTDKVIHVSENEFERMSDEELELAEQQLLEEKQKDGTLVIDIKAKSTEQTEDN